jgi:hypothetical protein
LGGGAEEGPDDEALDVEDGEGWKGGEEGAKVFEVVLRARSGKSE